MSSLARNAFWDRVCNEGSMIVPFILRETKNTFGDAIGFRK